MNKAILQKKVQQYINDHLNDDIIAILLGKSPFNNVSSKEIAEQIDVKKRAEKKLPRWFSTPNIYYPAKLSMEQASSEATAAYKSQLAHGAKLIDITGGYGVDSVHFSTTIKQVIHCEKDTSLSEIAVHNSSLLNADNIHFFIGDGVDYLLSTKETIDTVYLDPSRRVKTNKVFMLKDCEPDITKNLNLMLAKANRVILKTSPLLDLQSGLQQLQQVSEIHVLSVKNDCKEILWIIDRAFIGEVRIFSVAINNTEQQIFSFDRSEEKALTLENYSEPLQILYEPDVALLKAGCFKLIAKRYGIQKLHINTHLYTSNELKKEFIGRIFRVISSMSYKIFIKNSHLKKANIIARNFPLSTAELKKKHGLSDGGDDYLFFTTGLDNKLITIHAKRV